MDTEDEKGEDRSKVQNLKSRDKNVSVHSYATDYAGDQDGGFRITLQQHYVFSRRSPRPGRPIYS